MSKKFDVIIFDPKAISLYSIVIGQVHRVWLEEVVIRSINKLHAMRSDYSFIYLNLRKKVA